MSWIDWMLVVCLNGAIIVYALVRGRETESSSDWFLAGRTLPWWLVGLSLYATAIDSSDLVADSGGTYRLGMTYFVTNWVGTVAGWVIAAHFVVVPMYRLGMFTNAEYLEARFGLTARVISALVQVQYRTLVLGIIATTIYLTLNVVCGWDAAAWCAVVAIALLATVYTTAGGLRAVAVTDAFQSVVMVAAAVTLFALVYARVGGWQSVERRMAEHDRTLPARMLHVGAGHVETLDVAGQSREQVKRQLLLGGDHDEENDVIRRRTPAWLVSASMFIIGMAYSIVNHTQSMRMLGSRSSWDMQMSVVVASGLLLMLTFFNLTMGIMGRALYPELDLLPVSEDLRHTADTIYPILVREVNVVALKGVIVAGLLAASFSTYDSIGSTLSALLTRDVYARLLVTDRDDVHYLRVGRWLTPVVIFGSFAYVPFLLREGMLLFYIELVGAFVIPLLTVYLMGTFSRVHRRSGTVGLLIGVAYGMYGLLAEPVATRYGVAILPAALAGRFAAPVCSLIVTAATMLAVSLFAGWEPPGELLHEERSGWLRTSQRAVRGEVEGAPSGPRWLPAVLGVVVVAIGAVLSFVVFW